MASPRFHILNGDAVVMLRTLPKESVDCIVTSPPYWGLRNYGVEGQIGLEPTVAEFMERLLEVFEECKRVLKHTGTMWVNMGDAYATGTSAARKPTTTEGSKVPASWSNRSQSVRNGNVSGIPPKCLVGQPWRLAFALIDQGWILRRDIIWHKPSPMPESCRDRATTAHEYIFHFVKQPKYFYDQEAVREPCVSPGGGLASGWDTDQGSHGTIHRASLPASYKGKSRPGRDGSDGQDRRSEKPRTPKFATVNPSDNRASNMSRTAGWRKNEASGLRTRESLNANWDAKEAAGLLSETRNQRSVWTIATAGYKDAHFATFPEEIPRRCIRAGCPPGGVVLDPFAGSGTTLAVALAEGMSAIGIELNPDYVKLIEDRLKHTTPSLFVEAS